MNGCIAITHWEACETCANHGEKGCTLPSIDLHIMLGDWIICEQYEEEKNDN